MKKKLLLAFFVMILSVIALGVVNASAATYGDLTYKVSNGKVTITDCDESASGELVIPDKIGGYPVAAIDRRAFYKCSSLTSVIIPDGVTTIGDYAFYKCSSLTSVTIPDGVTAIGDEAFGDCSSIASVTIPDSVTTIGAYAFLRCSSLTSITIGDGVTTIGDNAFNGCSNLTSITIPDSVTTIGMSAFYGCDALTSVHITDLVAWCNIEFYYSNANPLYYANNLYLNGDLITNLTIPKGVTEIGYCTFYGCSSLTSVTIPDSVTTIGLYAFECCDSLTSVTIPDSVTKIGIGAFSNCRSLTSVTIGDGVTAISSGAFASCKSLTSVTIPDSVTTISDNAFSYCSSLTSITIPDSVTTIGYHAFYNTGCYNNTDNWENDVLYIGRHLIEAKTTLSGSYTIKDGTKTIGYEAFYNCRSLTSITIPDSVNAIGWDAFECCYNLTGVHITDLEAWCNIEFADFFANPLCYAYNLYLNGNLVTNLTIPDSVTTIGDYAFYFCSSLTSVTIPDSVTTIGSRAFDGCLNLKAAYYEGGKGNWNGVKVGAGNEDLTNALIFVWTETTVMHKGKIFVVTPVNIEVGKTVILALYDGNIFVEMHNATYEGEELIFVTDKAYTNAKVMVWDDLAIIKPVCGVEEIN